MPVTTTWGAGEYALMADRLRPAAARVVEAAGVRAADRVLDVATGTGNAALLAAALGADVVGVDFEPRLLEIAEHLAEASDLEVRWELADMTTLPVPDAWANVVLSVFGVMYAADHDEAARELARCVSTGGRIVLASWTPGSFMPSLGQALSAFLPAPPAGSRPPSRWGDPAVLADLFAPYGLAVHEHTTESLTMTFDSNRQATAFLVRTAGNVIAEREHLVAEGRWNDLNAAVTHLVEARGAEADGGLGIELAYLLTTIRHR
jgi:SAM-dependent methyltransferase